ncbi:hypothetical protein CLOSTHATH_00960 [Hungatella hathewayi DSM 13479]|uniref:Uncharacterized protein n=2 Tax=Clostridia TaxID=186801 RepID=D3ABI2_9FIRM|nr:hypothetical protein CLOSTHATH_00960 [Hungatella hathewayi DSM 13479]KXK66453.1 hypothetical protein HMPREF3293_00699 [Christensenella minuta]
MTRRHCPAGVFVKVHTSATEPAEMRKESNKTFPLPWPGRYFKATMME